MSDAAGRHDRARDLPGRTRSEGVDAPGRPVEAFGSPDRAGAPGHGDS